MHLDSIIKAKSQHLFSTVYGQRLREISRKIVPRGLEKLIWSLKISSFRVETPRKLSDWLFLRGVRKYEFWNQHFQSQRKEFCSQLIKRTEWDAGCLNKRRASQSVPECIQKCTQMNVLRKALYVLLNNVYYKKVFVDDFIFLHHDLLYQGTYVDKISSLFSWDLFDLVFWEAWLHGVQPLKNKCAWILPYTVW